MMNPVWLKSQVGPLWKDHVLVCDELWEKQNKTNTGPSLQVVQKAPGFAVD